MDYKQCWYKDDCPQQCSSHCIRFLVMNSLCENAHLPMKLRFPDDLYPEDSDYEAFTRLRDYKDNILAHVENGDNIYIYSSSCGNGKTTWSAKMIMKYFDCIWHKAGMSTKAVFLNVPDFIMRSKSRFKQDGTQFEELLEIIKQVPLVVWDDITSFENMTEYERTLILGLLDKRFNEGLSNIFTGNLLQETMYEGASQRIYGRLWNYCECIRIIGRDRRGDWK